MTRLPTIGALIGTAFGLAWAWAGSQSIASRGTRVTATWTAIAITVLIGGLLLFQSRWAQPPRAGTAPFRGGIYALAVVFEALAIPLALSFCRRSGREDLVIPAVTAIVGLHFFGLVAAMRGGATIFCWVGGAMTALGAVALCGARPESTQLWVALVSWGNALILWASAVSVLWR